MPAPTLEYGSPNAPTSSAYYRASNRVGLFELFASLAIAGLVVAIGAIFFGWMSQYSEHILIRPALPVAMGIGIGITMGAVMHGAVVRSRRLAMMLAAVMALFGYYLGWVAWEFFIFRRGGALFGWSSFWLLNPKTVFEAAQLINFRGTWSLKFNDIGMIRGGDLLCFWVVEAVAIFGSAMLTAFGMFPKEVYCETCRRWCAPSALIYTMNPGDNAVAREKLEALDVDYFRPLLIPPVAKSRYWTLHFEGCRNCDSLAMLNLIDVDYKSTRNGPQRVRKALVHRLIVDGARMEAFVTALLPEAQDEVSEAAVAPLDVT